MANPPRSVRHPCRKGTNRSARTYASPRHDSGTAQVETRPPSLAAKPPVKYKPLFGLAALRDPQRTLYRWWNLWERLGPAAGFMRATLSGDMYLEQKALLGVSLEALIGRAHKTVPQAPGLNTQLAKDLTITRNAIAHLEPGLSGKALEGEDLIYAQRNLQLVIEINLLLDLGLTKQLVLELVSVSYDGGRQVPLADYRR